MCIFIKGGQVYPVPPSFSQRCTCFVVSPLCLWWMAVVVGCMRGNEVSGGVFWLWEPCRAYLKRFSPAPSSHWGCCTMIWCAVTWDPCMQRWVARTKVIAILILTYTHVLQQDCFHLVAGLLANLFRVAVASTPSSPSTETTKGENFRRCWRQASIYILFSPVPPRGGTSLGPLSCASGHQCS